MNLRNKIIVYFSTTLIALLAISLFLIFVIFSNYRQNEFYERLKERALTNFKYLIEIDQIDHQLLKLMDKVRINNLFEEKVLIYNQNKELIYSSVDDIKIEYPEKILNRLSPEHIEYETEDEKGFEILGLYIEKGGQHYYSIAKAFDVYGNGKISYLKLVLLLTFFICSAVVVFISILISKQLSGALTLMTKEVEKVDIQNNKSFITVPEGRDEIRLLAEKFNELLESLSQSFKFQNHFVHHVSHELKTPIAILVSNLERLENEKDMIVLKRGLQNQKEGVKELADIINALLEISKSETNQNQSLNQTIRLDELIFEVMDELNFLNDRINFDFVMDEKINDEKKLTITGNQRLLKSAFMNLARNAIQYGNERKALIRIENAENGIRLKIINEGPTLNAEEQQFLFSHFFRGKNSRSQKGFGLGLVLTNRIILLHRGTLKYQIMPDSSNCFEVFFPSSTLREV